MKILFKKFLCYFTHAEKAVYVNDSIFCDSLVHDIFDSTPTAPLLLVLSSCYHLLLLLPTPSLLPFLLSSPPTSSAYFLSFLRAVSSLPTGTYRGGHEVLVRAKLALADGVTMQLTVRSDDPEVSEVIASAVG